MPPGFADVDGKHVGRLGAGQHLGVGQRVDAFVGDDRHGHVSPHLGQRVVVAGRHRLLGEIDIALVAQAADRVDRDLRRRPAAVGIDAEFHFAAHGLAHCPHAGHVAGRIDADLDLHLREALGDGPACNLGSLRRLDTGDGPLRGHGAERGVRSEERGISILTPGSRLPAPC